MPTTYPLIRQQLLGRHHKRSTVINEDFTMDEQSNTASNIWQWYRRLTKKDVIFFVSVAIVALAVATAPYIIERIKAPDNQEFRYLPNMNLQDTNAYYSMINQAAHGQWLMENLYTSEPQHGTMFHPLWLMLGWIVRISGWSVICVFHGARIVFGALLLWYLYYAIGQFINKRVIRNVAFILAGFSSGIGYISLRLGWHLSYEPIDQWVPESNTLLTLNYSPLFIVSQLLLLMIFIELIRNKWGWLKFALLAGLLSLIHPYDGVIVMAVSTTYLLLRLLRQSVYDVSEIRHIVARWLGLALGVSVMAIYYWLIIRHEPAIGGWLKNNITLTPPPDSFVVGLGLLLPLALIGGYSIYRSRRAALILLLSWFGTGLLLIYFPFQFNRRMTNGIHIPLIIMATFGLFWLGRKMNLGNSYFLRWFVWLIGAILLCTSLFYSNLATVFRPSYQGPPELLGRTDAIALDWLNRNIPVDAVILSSTITGNSIPAITGRRVYAGHSHQTIDFSHKRNYVDQWFYQSNDQDEAKAHFLINNNISYVMYGTQERLLGSYRPNLKSYLRLVFRSDQSEVYQVNK